MDRCNGEWLVCAKRVLCQNNFNIYVYCCNPCRYHYLRQKNNIILVGPTNCGKPFFLNPLEIVFKSFVNPANRKYPWVGLEECEVAYLNDYSTKHFICQDQKTYMQLTYVYDVTTVCLYLQLGKVKLNILGNTMRVMIGKVYDGFSMESV